MADSDPISEASPSSKRRKLQNGSAGKTWSSDNDSGDDLFDHDTIATLPLTRPFGGSQNRGSQDVPLSYATQPTQAPRPSTQQTQFTYASQAPKHAPNVQVERSSPVLMSPPQRAPPPAISKAPFAKPGSMLANIASMAPRGTTIRKPVVPPQKEVVEIESDESDPPVDHSSDEDSRGLASNIRPTQFIRGGRGLNSSPNQVVRDSPRIDPAPSVFSSLVSQFKHQQTDDMTSSYSGTSRGPRPVSTLRNPSTAQQATSGSAILSIDDVQDFRVRSKIERMQAVLGEDIPVARYYDALRRKHMNYDDALNFLVDEGNRDTDMVDDLAPTPFKHAQRSRGVAQSSPQRPSQPTKPSAKQGLTKPVQSIASRYTSNTNDGKQWRPSYAQASDDSPDVPRKPKGRMLKHRRPRTPSPEVAPTGRRLMKKSIIDDDSEEEAVSTPESSPPPKTFQQRVLRFFNTADAQEIIDLSDAKLEDVEFVMSKRPFRSFAQINAVDRDDPAAKKKRRGGLYKSIGEKLLTTCQGMLAGYEAVDHLVNKCEALSKPMLESLKSWGVGSAADGELRLMNMEELHDSGIGTPSSSYSDTKQQKLGSFLPQPSNMSTEVMLKDYQLVGLNWLHLLYTGRTSCILADDMGLGKTCQIIAFLAQLQLEKVDGVHLIIVPGSTLENWLRELKRFAPSLAVFPYYGSLHERPDLQQQLEETWGDWDVVVTTYDMAVTDNMFLRNLEPNVCVYDEAHALKNTESKRYTKLMRIPADFKILLTGTPLQNNLRELVAILAFIMPDLFNEKKEDLEHIFKHKAKTNSDNHDILLSAQRTERARSMITPFILRRKKAQVLDLPAKHSRVEYCELSDTQAEIYNKLQDDVRQMFADREAGIGKKIGAKDRTNVLMQLRKAAIHPLLFRRIFTDKKIDKITSLLMKDAEFGENPRDRVVKYLTGEAVQSLKGNDFSLHVFCSDRDYLNKYALKNDEWMDSGKVQKFKELVQEYVKNGDKLLVFSQFTMVMDILEAVLETLGIKFMRLDGSTEMASRQSMIDEFNTNEEITVFMLSTKAGGAGINLASANKVIIFDSGFNPQDDIQAENRAHRVGQTREVEVIRLVCKDTIEEPIHALGKSKLALDDRVAGEGATAADEKAAEKAGEAAVEQMLKNTLQGKKNKTDHTEEPSEEEEDSNDAKLKQTDVESLQQQEEDVKDAFKKGLQSNGLQID